MKGEFSEAWNDLRKRSIDGKKNLDKEEAKLWGQRFEVPEYHGYTENMQEEACEEYAKRAYKRDTEKKAMQKAGLAQ